LRKTSPTRKKKNGEVPGGPPKRKPSFNETNPHSTAKERKPDGNATAKEEDMTKSLE